MTFNLCPLRKFILWSLQSGLAARQVTAEPCHFGPCQLSISSAPAVLAFRSWLKSFKQAIWHTFQLLVSLGDRATSPKGVIYIPWLLGSLQKRSERKTTCQEDPRFGEHHDHRKQERKIQRKVVPWSLHLWAAITWGDFFFFLVCRKRQLQLKPNGKCHCTSCIDFKSRPPNEPVIRIFHSAPVAF